MNIKRFKHITDEKAVELFHQMDSEGTKKQVFHDGLIRTPWDFLEHIRSGLVWGGFVFEDETPIACFWVNNITGNTAFFHYWVYKSAWGGGRYKEISAYIMQYIADNTHLTSVCGQTPVHLKLAMRAIKACKFRVIGIIPEAVTLYTGDIVDIMLSNYDLKPLKEGE